MLHNGNLVINEWIYIQPGRYLLHNNDFDIKTSFLMKNNDRSKTIC